MKQDGHTVLLTTHNIDEAEQLCDRIAIIDHGRIIADRSAARADRPSRPRCSRVADRPRAAARSARLLGAMPGVEDLTCDGPTAHVHDRDVSRTVGGTDAIVEARGVEISELQCGRRRSRTCSSS